MAINDFFKIYEDAVWCKDSTAMLNLYDRQAIIFDTWDRGFVVDSAEWNKTIEDWFSSLGDEKVKVEFDKINIHQADNVGFASALIKYEAISSCGEVLRSMKNRITIGFLRVEDDWRVIHQHMSSPVSSDGLTALLEF